MAKKKYYAVRHGKEIGVYDDWTKVQELVKGFNNPEFKSFKTREEAEDYLENGDAQKTLKLKENEMITNGTWEDYLLNNITCENLKSYDALCFSDASAVEVEQNGKKKAECASFGLIIIPLNDGKLCGDIIVESAFLKDKEENDEKCHGNFERKRFDLKGTEITEEIEFNDEAGKTEGSDLCQEGGYITTGGADRAESESAVRVLEICSDLYKSKEEIKILYISDCLPLLQAIKKRTSDKPGNQRVLRTMNQKNVTLDLRKVGSHTNAFYGEVNDVGRDSNDELSRTRTRLFYLLNDLTDLMAKAELPPKSGTAASENKVSIHLIPNKNGEYVTEGQYSDINKIYNKNLTCVERRKITREMIERVIPLIKTALENSQN